MCVCVRDVLPGLITVHVCFVCRAWLVPVFSFGENELFDQMENPAGSALRRMQDRLQRIMGVAMPLFHARGVFQYSFGLLPYRKPIHTVGTYTHTHAHLCGCMIRLLMHPGR